MRLNRLLIKPARWAGKTFDGGKDRSAKKAEGVYYGNEGY